MESIYLFGIGTTSKRVKAFIQFNKIYKVRGFIVDDNYKTKDFYDNEKIYSLTEFRNLPNYKSLPVFICIAWNRLNEDRKQVFQKYNNELNLVNIISPKSVVRGILKGKNIFIGDFVVLEVGSNINNNVFVDHGSFIGTDTIIDEHSYIGAKSMIAGNSHIGSQTFIGINSTVFDNVKIGQKCIISGGEIIKRNANNYTVIKSVNNKQHYKSYPEKIIINKLLASKNVR